MRDRDENGVPQLFLTSLWEDSEREKKEWGGVYRAIWDEIRGERRRTAREREKEGHGRERRDE